MIISKDKKNSLTDASLNNSVGEIAQKDSGDDSLIMEMVRAGILYGHRKSRKNPAFSKYVFGIRNGVEVIDLSITLEAIEKVSQFLKEKKSEKSRFLVVGTQPVAREAVLQLSNFLNNSPYVVNKWIGGLITNFPIIYKRIEYYKKKKKDFEEKRFENYTKKERLLISREIERMERNFSGLEDYSKIPDIVFLIDSSLKGHKIAVSEAKKKGITLIGIIDNDDNPNDFDLFIPANDHSKSSINWIVDKIIAKA